MDPECNVPEPEDDMPPIDDELREAMEDMAQRMDKCDKLQKLLALLSAVCFWNVVGGGSLFVNFGVMMTWNGLLCRKAEKLIIRAYPWIHNIPFLYGPSGGKHYNGITAGTWIKAEAEKTGDVLTLRLLRFVNQKGMRWVFIGMLGYIATLILFGGLMKDFMI